MLPLCRHFNVLYFSSHCELTLDKTCVACKVLERLSIVQLLREDQRPGLQTNGAVLLFVCQFCLLYISFIYQLNMPFFSIWQFNQYSDCGCATFLLKVGCLIQINNASVVLCLLTIILTDIKL